MKQKKKVDAELKRQAEEKAKRDEEAERAELIKNFPYLGNVNMKDVNLEQIMEQLNEDDESFESSVYEELPEQDAQEEEKKAVPASGLQQSPSLAKIEISLDGMSVDNKSEGFSNMSKDSLAELLKDVHAIKPNLQVLTVTSSEGQ